ncbi:MAG: FtsQ-type POTRA domain-containing protein [Clostridiales bacterium]|nr:FtsQ-type POTRA domain-containing protein [Clostridiales bacterium]
MYRSFSGLYPMHKGWGDWLRGSKKKRYMFLILILFLATIGILYLGTESFQIKKITVVGNEKIKKEDIIKRSGISYKQNILKLDKGLVKERIETIPYLEVMSIKLSYPDEVIITVYERKTVAIIPYLNSYFIIDKDCNIVEITDELDDIGYPLVQDMEIRSFVVGKKLVTEEEYQVKVLSRILESIYQLELENQISEIMMGNPDDIELILTEGIRTRIGQAIEMDKKLIWLKSDKLKEVCQGLTGGILDLSAPSKPVFYPDES